MLVTRQLIADEYTNMTQANESVHKMANNFSKTNKVYGEYETHIGKSQKLVRKIQEKEWWDHFKLMASFYTFMASALYLFLKRFYLHELVAYAFGIQNALMAWTIWPVLMLLQRLFRVDFMNYYTDWSFDDLVAIQ